MFGTRAPQDFQTAFKEWRASRPEWQTLLKAIRRESDASGLAADAGCTPEELRELIMVRDNARGRASEAQRYATAKKRLAELDSEIEKLRARAEAASADQYDEAMTRLQGALNARERFYQSDCVGPELAHRYVEEVARPMGLV